MTSVTQEGEIIETHAIVKLDPIVKPAVSPEAAIHAWDEYQLLKQRIAKPEDFQRIQGKDFPKKSLWRKLATFFNLSLEVVSEKEIKNEDGSIDFDIVYKAVAPNGRSTIGDGSCNSNEKGRENSRHNTRSTAHTRAFNRAVSNLIGGGEVSAEEVEVESFQPTQHHIDPRPKGPAPSAEYRIQLGEYKNKKTGEFQSHWLNGKSLQEAYEIENKTAHRPELLNVYDFYSKSNYKPDEVKEFLRRAEEFLREKGEIK